MSLHIDFRLDDPVDLKDLLGEFVVRDDSTAFSRTDTYVDSWLETLVGLVRLYRREGNGKAEVVEEPVQLSLAGPPNECVLGVGHVRFAPLDFQALEHAVYEAVHRLLSAFQPGVTLTPVLKDLRTFLEEGIPKGGVPAGS